MLYSFLYRGEVFYAHDEPGIASSSSGSLMLWDKEQAIIMPPPAADIYRSIQARKAAAECDGVVRHFVEQAGPDR